MIVVNGQVKAIWKRQIKAKSITITLHPFTDLSEWQEDVTEAAQSFAAFMGLPVSIT